MTCDVIGHNKDGRRCDQINYRFPSGYVSLKTTQRQKSFQNSYYHFQTFHDFFTISSPGRQLFPFNGLSENRRLSRFTVDVFIFAFVFSRLQI